jgi:pimeloyl-ACP methyl ester carboxylesterase
VSGADTGLTIAAEGDRHAAIILFIPPLFDEGNRLRRTLVLTMRALAARGHECWLPDLPGQNDSLVPTEAATLTSWRDALATVVRSSARPVVTAAWRAGALLDMVPSVAARWRMAPSSGASVLRTLARTRVAGEKEAGREISLDALMAQMRAATTEVAGNRLSPAMVAELEAAVVADAPPLRTVAVGNGTYAVPGSALWLRAEPGEDRAMAEAMAADIAAWAQSCVGG